MPPAINLTGRWSGHYYQHGVGHPIAVDLVQAGEKLTGTMTDTHTRSEKTVFDVAVEQGLPPGADEQITQKLREMFPDSGRDPIRYVVELPSDSVLEGKVKEQTVTFRKTYQGEHFSGYRVGERMVGDRKPGHIVHYKGRLSADGSLIEGKWSITQKTDEGTRTVDGNFELRRDAPPPPG